jgi:hypothetical protein
VIVYISIGNSDDKLTQARWSEFYNWVAGSINMFASVHHGKWVSDPTEPWQNACWCVLVEEGKVERLKARLRNTAVEFDQDSIAWAEAPHTEFIGASS